MRGEDKVDTFSFSLTSNTNGVTRLTGIIDLLPSYPHSPKHISPSSSSRCVAYAMRNDAALAQHADNTARTMTDQQQYAISPFCTFSLLLFFALFYRPSPLLNSLLPTLPYPPFHLFLPPTFLSLPPLSLLYLTSPKKKGRFQEKVCRRQKDL